MATPSRGPSVRFPPPLLWVGGWIVAWGLGRLLIFEIDDDGVSRVQGAVGTSLLGGGLLVMGWGVVTFVKCRTAIYPNQPARVLVDAGPYRLSRNPMYVGLTLLYVGLAVVLNLAWPLVVLPAVMLTLRTAVIAREEAHLRDRFGADYDAYCRRVRRWL